MGVHGICSNDPRLFAVAERAPAPEPEKPAKLSRAERREEKKAAKEAAKEQKAEEAG
jgi:hypothetical protein